MNELYALLAAIHAAPDDDAPRLIFADWLDEYGHPERAELFRVQIEMRREYDAHKRPTPRLEALFLRQRELIREPWADVTRRWGTGHISAFSRGFPFQLTINLTEAEIDQENSIVLWLGPETHIVLARGGGSLTALAQTEQFRFVRRLTLRPQKDLKEFSNADVAGVFQSPNSTGLLEFNAGRSVFPLQRAPLTAAAAKAIAGARSLPGLRSLNLSNQRVRDTGVGYLAKAPHLSTLRHLYLEGNEITSRGLTAILDSPYFTDLETLDLFNNDLKRGDSRRIRRRYPRARLRCFDRAMDEPSGP